MDKHTRTSPRHGTASGSASGRPIRTTASYMHTAKAEAVEENVRRSKKSKRRAKRNESTVKKPFPWLKILIAMAIVAVIAVVLVLILGSNPKVIHQMPKVTPPEPAENAETLPASGEASVTITVDTPPALSDDGLPLDLGGVLP